MIFLDKEWQMEEINNVCNVQSEIMFVGSLYKSPDLYVTYGNFMRPKYDFSDEVVYFFYKCLETYYLKFSQTVDETKLNVFMSQDAERMSNYKKYHGWKTISEFMRLADPNDTKNYFDTVKKYSLVREYGRNGYPVDKILAHKNFDKMTANDIYRVIRAKADKIHTVINAGEEAVELTKGNADQIKRYLKKPNFGLPYPWPMYNEFFLGMREGKTHFEGFISNGGKSRKLIALAAYVTLVQHENFLLMSNEMDEDDLKNCMIVTVINNKEYQELHGIQIKKPEREIVLGAYRDRNGEIIRRHIDENGIYTESEEEYIERVERDSDEYHKIVQVGEWIDENTKGKLLYKDVQDDYSMERIEFELRKAKLVNEVTYYGYDTLKNYQVEDWAQLKQIATKLKEITKELKMFGFAVFQLSDDSKFTDVFQLSSMNIASSKGIKHVTDTLTLGKMIEKSEYHKYQMICDTPGWGDPTISDLDLGKQYFAIKIDKNRAGSKDKIMLFEINLDYNTWINIGQLIQRQK